jgi:Tfp pilus assembly protein PilX
MKERGFTLFIAIVITATLLVVAMSIVSLAVREAQLSSTAKQSQYAFYAADTGIECAIYWDVQNPTGYSAFSTTTGSQIDCNRDATNASNGQGGNQFTVGGSQSAQTGIGLSIMNKITFLPDPYCAIVTVTKNIDGSTQIESKGYNTCDPSNPRRVERAVKVSY